MSAQLINGTELSKSIRASVTQRVKQLSKQGITPGLAVILVGENPASQVYVRNKVKSCEEVGFYSILESIPATISESELLTHIEKLNKNPKIHGILVQLPLPKHIDSTRVI